MVQQARDALELYYAKSRGIALARRPSVVVRHPPAPVRLRLPPLPRPAPTPRPPAAGVPTPTRYATAVREVKEGCRETVKNGGAAATGTVNWKVLEARVRDCLRIEHYSYSTEQTYVGWIRFSDTENGSKELKTWVSSM